MSLPLSIFLALVVVTVLIISGIENKKKVPDKNTGANALILSALIIFLFIVAIVHFLF